ncbi:unnamed protein product [Echinostoma caproni]|uniref:Mcl1_mid domain-containing protein n=1 Tax=Echinostoma caproni TaxID=27848 RepID=A0A183AMP2_9TREM|nr:unnamed protein product [Echinostoma caproni]
MNALLGCDEDGDTDELLRAAAAQAESSRLIDDDELVRKIATGAPGDASDDDDDVHSIDLSRIKSGFLDLDGDMNPDAPVVDGQKEVNLGTAALDTVMKTAGPLGPSAAGAGQDPSRLTNRVQQPFQPGSMPLGFHERFMVWNRYGLVIQYRSTDSDTEKPDDVELTSAGSIEVEFHDTTVHHSLRLSNTTGYTMADLSLTGLLLASPGVHDPSLVDDADTGELIDPSDISQIAVLPLDTSKVGGGDSSSEWTIKLPPGEACEAVCLVPSDDFQTNQTEPGYAVVATSRRFLRIFAQPTPSAALLRPSTSLHLFQITKLGLPPVSLPGCGVVAMASHPSRAVLVKLTWFGFSDLGGLFTHDASGVVRRLIHGRCAPTQDYHWAPVCDTRAVLKPSNRHSDTYFIVGVVESADTPAGTLSADHIASESDREAPGIGQLQALYCKASKWPRVFPRPVICSLPFRLPLCSMDTDQGSLEETDSRSHQHPSGSRDEDLTNVSLVSSATDDTHEEGHISGLPLPDSEPITQSLLSNTPSTARNPFRDSFSSKIPSNTGTPRDEPKLRARGSEVLDTWQPLESVAGVDNTGSKVTKKVTQSNKKRIAPVSAEKRRSKIAKPSVLQTEDVEGFMEWFDANREQLEEEYPEQSAEELLRTARGEYQKMKASVISAELRGKENETPSSQISSQKASKKGGKSNFAHKASKRLSSFKFDTNEDN